MSLSSLGGWVFGCVFDEFLHIVLYWYGEKMTGLIQLFDPLSQFVRNSPADQWFAYGTLYTFGVLVYGL
ncbi:MAG: hypothetical protein U5L45_18095 [Saprospiraceae bacterium]|nr:hypothetical protein [Saprospiraceae bacterium]